MFPALLCDSLASNDTVWLRREDLDICAMIESTAENKIDGVFERVFLSRSAYLVIADIGDKTHR